MVSGGIETYKHTNKQTDKATQLCVYLIGFINNKMNKLHM